MPFAFKASRLKPLLQRQICPVTDKYKAEARSCGPRLFYTLALVAFAHCITGYVLTDLVLADGHTVHFVRAVGQA